VLQRWACATMKEIMSYMLDKDTIKRILYLHQVQGLKIPIIAERFGFSSARVHGVIRRQAASSKSQASSLEKNTIK
jgi:DNA-binding transcriptional regulator LsrR (DeoR family)